MWCNANYGKIGYISKIYGLENNHAYKRNKTVFRGQEAKAPGEDLTLFKNVVLEIPIYFWMGKRFSTRGLSVSRRGSADRATLSYQYTYDHRWPLLSL